MWEIVRVRRRGSETLFMQFRALKLRIRAQSQSTSMTQVAEAEGVSRCDKSTLFLAGSANRRPDRFQDPGIAGRRARPHGGRAVGRTKRCMSAKKRLNGVIGPCAA
jgi:hypothetical protein